MGRQSIGWFVACVFMAGACSSTTTPAVPQETSTTLPAELNSSRSTAAPDDGGDVDTQPELSGEAGDVAFTPVDIAVEAPNGFSPAGPPLDVQVADGVVDEPVLLSIPGTAPPAGDIPLLLHRNEIGDWETVVAEYVDGRYEAEVMSFSWYWPGWAADALDNVVDWVTGRTDPPEPCGTAVADDGYDWVLADGGPSDGAIHACVDKNPDVDGTERVEVKIKSNRAFAMWVVVPRTNADYVWVEGSMWDQVGDVLNAVTSRLPDRVFAPTVLSGPPIPVLVGGTEERILLAPGRTLTVGYQRPVATDTFGLFAYQDTITQYFSMLSRHLGEVDAVVGTTLAIINCLDNGIDVFADASINQIADCASATAGVSSAQLEVVFDDAVDSGRLALSNGDRGAFKAAVWQSNRAGAALGALKKVSAVLSAARIATDAVVLANDAALGLSSNAGQFQFTLLSEAPSAQSPPDGNAFTPTAVSVDEQAGTQQIRYDHPQLGAMSIELTGTGPRGAQPALVARRTDNDSIVFSWSSVDGFDYSSFAGLGDFAGVDGPVDALGHIFFRFNPGRYDGVSVLVPTADGFDDLATLPSGDLELANYGGSVIDSDADSIFEIEVDVNSCNPTCAGGGRTITQYVWGGNDYEPGDVERVPPYEPTDDSFPLTEWDQGTNVSYLQDGLQLLGYDIGTSGADGMFGPATETAVRQWQADTDLDPTGFVTQEDFHALVIDLELLVSE